MGHSFVASLPSSRCAAVARDRVNLCTIVFESEKCIFEPCHRVKRRNCVIVSVPLIRRLKCIADRKMTYIVRLVVVCVLVGLIDSNPAVDSGGVVNHLVSGRANLRNGVVYVCPLSNFVLVSLWFRR